MPTLYQWSVPQRRQPTFVWAPSRDIDRPTRACGKPEAGSHSPNRRQHVHLHSMTLDMKILLHLDPFFFFFSLLKGLNSKLSTLTRVKKNEWFCLFLFLLTAYALYTITLWSFTKRQNGPMVGTWETWDCRPVHDLEALRSYRREMVSRHPLPYTTYSFPVYFPVSNFGSRLNGL